MMQCQRDGSMATFVTPTSLSISLTKTTTNSSTFITPLRPTTLQQHISNPVRTTTPTPIRARIATPSSSDVMPTLRTYRQQYPLTDEVKTSVHAYTDARGHSCTYPLDILRGPSSPLEAGGGAPKHVVFCLHTANGLGVNRLYWDRLFNYLGKQPSMFPYESTAFVRFDWVGTGETEPKMDYVNEPLDTEYFTHHLQHVIETTLKQLNTNSQQSNVILLAQGASEPICLTLLRNNNNNNISKASFKVKAIVVSTGLSSKSLTKKPSVARMKLSYDVLKSATVGLAFWNFVTNRKYITNFSLKNLLSSDQHVQQWVDAALVGAVHDNRIRFNVFSFISGYLFNDYRDDLKALTDVQYAFFGGSQKASKPDDLSVKLKTTRPPVPFVISERAFKDEAVERIEFRRALVQKDLYKGVICQGCGFEMFFEQAETAMRYLKQFIDHDLLE